MKYITGHVWLREHEQAQSARESVLLQQVCYDACHIVLACVCDGSELGGYVTGRLKSWLQVNCTRLFGKNKDVKTVSKELAKELAVLRDETADHMAGKSSKEDRQHTLNLSGILIVDKICFLFSAGEGCFYLLNRRFNMTHRKKLAGIGTVPWQITEGIIQKKVGILLGTASFLGGVGKEAMRQCMAAQDIEREGQIDRRLREMALESCRQGYHGDCSAVYIRSV